MSDANYNIKYYLVYAMIGGKNQYIHDQNGDLVAIPQIKGAQKFRLSQAKAFIEMVKKQTNTQYHLQAIQ